MLEPGAEQRHPVEHRAPVHRGRVVGGDERCHHLVEIAGREREIARLVAARRSNKEIGAALGISSRTVSTHLSNVFAKLGVASRGELTDRVREDESLGSQARS